ncbi:hypothetical protein, partial [Mycobacterium tuberculosis]|uniref:hypothetical protein n=1 Tax=Mycobacterium tuberculosis TaxID=1773 RepID=UPI001F235648
LLDEPPDMTPSFPRTGVSGHAGAVHTGRLFAVSLLPGSPDRLVLTASRLCVDDASWQTVVEDLVRQYDESVLVPAR